MERNYITNFTVQEIAHHLIDNKNNSLADRSDYTIVILGKPGPRGKTWLCEALRQNGFNAIEISEDLACLIPWLACDDRNHCIVDIFDKHITIVLNAEFGG